MSALRGKRVLVTRAREQAEKTAAAFRARGAEPVLLPAIEIHPPKDVEAVRQALARAGEYAWVAFTSENGVEWTWKALEALRGARGGSRSAARRSPRSARGRRRRSRATGLRPDVVARESKGEGLARAMLGAMEPGDSLLLFRAQVAREVFPEALRAAGHPVDIVAVYETRPAAGPGVAQVVGELERGAIDAVTFTSAGTVESFCALVGGDAEARELLGRTLVGSIGPITSEALVARGLRVDATAEATTLEALLDALEARFLAAGKPHRN